MTTLGPSIGEYPIYTAGSYRVLAEDEARVSAFTAAIEAVAPGRDVLDVGTGGELLWARVAARVARRVVAVESMADSHLQAVRTLEWLRNVQPAIAERITLVQGEATEAELPACDVVVAEIIGSFAGAEGAAAVLSTVRGRALRASGVCVPNAAHTLIAAADTRHLLASLAARPAEAELEACRAIFEHYGRRFDVRLRVAGADPRGLRSVGARIEELYFNGDLRTAQCTVVQLELTTAGPVDALVCWLELEVADGAPLLDSMFHDTSWGSILLPLPGDGLQGKPGDIVEVAFSAELSDDGVHPDYEFKIIDYRDGKALAKAEVMAAHHYGPVGSTALHRWLLDALDTGEALQGSRQIRG